MPTINIRRFPLPSVSIYLILSASLLMLAIMWANNTLVEEQEFFERKSLLDKQEYEIDDTSPHEKLLQETTKKKAKSEIWSYPSPKKRSSSSITFSVKRDTNNEDDGPFIGTEIAKAIADGEYSFAYGVLKLMLDEPLCLMLVVNATYCVLIVFMHVIQRIVFGRLRPIERQHIKVVYLFSFCYRLFFRPESVDKFWNFVFYKFIFIFGVMNVQSLNEVLIWVSWFTAIAFLLLLTKLSKDRFEFLSFSPNTPMFYHWKVVGLLLFILFFCVLLGISCVAKRFPFSSFSVEYYDIHSTTFMLAEAVIIAIKAIHVLMRYSIHLYDIQHTELWERKATLVYHVDLVMELLSLMVNFVHHLHMLFSGNIWLSMASLVICMQLRFIFSEIQKRYLRHKNYRRVVANMDAQFPAASQEELTQHEDRCAICWDQMETARKLPCGHLFHAACLRSWLEQDTTCPTCRKQLGIRQNSQEQANADNAADGNEAGANIIPGGVPAPDGDLTPAVAAGAAPQRNHFWHFDGSRIASWLPSFSVEVTHSLRGRERVNQEMSNSQLDSMVRDVHEIFPQIPSRLIANDLRVTGSVEATTNNILEGNIVVPPDQMLPPSQTSAERPPDFQIPVSTRSLPIMSSTTVRRRQVVSMSDSTLGDRPYPDPPPTPSTETLSSALSDESSNETSSIPESVGGNAPPSPTYGHFSKAPEERETILQTRRDIMVRQARLKYLNRTLQQKTDAETSVTRSEETCTAESSKGQRSQGHSSPELAHASSQPNIRLRHVTLNPNDPSNAEILQENKNNEAVENTGSSVG